MATPEAKHSKKRLPAKVAKKTTKGSTGKLRSLTKPVSVTLPEGLIAEVDELAGPGGRSAAAVEALTVWVANTRFRQVLEEYERETGEITDDEIAAVVAKVGGL